jgi:hypothetical protein
MRNLLFGAVAVAAALTGAVPSTGHAQVAGTSGGGGYSYVVPPLSLIERSQHQQLEANRNVINNQLQDRYQNSLELEKQFYDENRRRREDYRFQGNTSQRALETQLREDAVRINQQDQAARERELRNRAQADQGIDQARRNLGN